MKYLGVTKEKEQAGRIKWGHELSTVYPKPQIFNCLKKHSIVIVHLWADKNTPKI